MTTTPPPGAAFVVWLIVLVAAGTMVMVLFKVAVWWGSRVNDYADADADDMSSADAAMPPSRLSSLETDRRADRQTEQPARVSAEQLLTLYQLMRAAGIGREDARAAFKAAGLPLNNDVWSKAAPPPKVPQPTDDDDTMITPYAGRRTRASYYPEEPELEYRSPA